jgi:putative transposase
VAAFIAAQRDRHRIPHAVACRALGISQSWYYQWASHARAGTSPPRAARRARLAAEVRRLVESYDGKRGSPMITADLQDAGWRVSKNTVAALMAGQNLAARPRRRRKSATRPGRGRWRAPDLVKRQFPAARPNQKWYGDGTEIPTGEGKPHLVSVMEAASRRILGFTLSEHHDAAAAYGALTMAVAVRGGQAPGVIMPTDQGSEYTARAFQACQRLGIAQPLGRPGPALDNAVIESWHSTVEFELRRVQHFATRAAGPHRGGGLDRGLQHPPPALLLPEDAASGLRAAAGGPGGGSLTMTPPLPPASIRRCSARSRSFLPGPDGPAGAPPGQRLRSGALIGLRENREQKQDRYYKVSTVRGEPPAAARARSVGCVRVGPSCYLHAAAYV